MTGSRHAWVLLALLVALSAAPGMTRAEPDHLRCVGAKRDISRKPDPPTFPADLDVGVLGLDDCLVKASKPVMQCYPTERDGGDDPLGGPTAVFVCYKVKCRVAASVETDTADALGVRRLRWTRPKLVCSSR